MYLVLLLDLTLMPSMVKDFQKVISQEARRQILEKENRLPDMVIACVGGGSNAIGAFAEFIPDKDVKLVGVEAAGKGIDTDRHAATLTLGTVGVIDGMNTYALFNERWFCKTCLFYISWLRLSRC